MVKVSSVQKLVLVVLHCIELLSAPTSCSTVTGEQPRDQNTGS